MFIGLVVGYAVYELILAFSHSFTHNLMSYLQFSSIELIYLLSLVSFIGVYIARLTYWTLNLISD